MTKFYLSIFTATLMLFGGIGYAEDEVEETQAPAEEIAEVETGRIIFYRVGTGGGAVKFHVHTMEGDPVGYLGKKGDAFAIDVEPGTQRYWSRAASRNDVILEVVAGETHYVKGKVKMGAAVGRPVLEEVPKSKVPDWVLEQFDEQ